MKTSALRTGVVASLRFLSLALFSVSVAAAPAPGLLDNTHAKVRAVVAVQSAVTTDLMRIPEILGTAVGVDANDEPTLVIYVDSEGTGSGNLVRALPPQLRGVAVSVHVTDKFRALRKPPTGGGDGGTSTLDHTGKQTTPILLGTSGGWRNDLANGYCCGGTLGSLVQVNGVQFIMSNYHVLEADIVPGGNNLVALTGSPVIQPGLIDVSCNANSAQVVATLRKISSLPNSNVDCSVAEVQPGMVSPDGAILGIGPISSQTVGAALNMGVKKSGRTTGLKSSSIAGLNATVRIAYDNECAGGAAFTKTFTGQIVIANRGSKFLAGGDSGSLMVENVANRPRAVGLLYAGSSTSAIANPIGEVLAFIGASLGGTATMVGQ